MVNILTPRSVCGGAEAAVSCAYSTRNMYLSLSEAAGDLVRHPLVLNAA
jgi:hypothetical protein